MIFSRTCRSAPRARAYQGKGIAAGCSIKERDCRGYHSCCGIRYPRRWGRRRKALSQDIHAIHTYQCLHYFDNFTIGTSPVRGLPPELYIQANQAEKAVSETTDRAHLLRMSYGNEWKEAVRLLKKPIFQVQASVRRSVTANQVRSTEAFRRNKELLASGL